MEDTMNRLWRGFAGTPAYRESAEDWNIAIDVVQKKDDYEVRASVPGIKPEEIDVSIEDNVLTIKAEKKTESETEDENYLVREHRTGSFYRALRLPDTIDTEKVKSRYEDGILTIALPKAEEKKRKQIKVSVSGGAKAIEAKK
jgi:HSP20 family protein